MNSSADLINQFNFSLKKRLNFFICKKSKINISFLNLLLTKGLILNFYQFKHFKDKICVFLKYFDRKPLVKKINLVTTNKFVTSKRLKGDLQNNVFFVISSNTGNLILISSEDFMKLNWFNSYGGKFLFKLFV